jgi:hypothetical protein
MNNEELIKYIQDIVLKAKKLKDEYIEYKDIPVNYACIFSQSEEEYEKLNNIVGNIGKIIKETPSGLLYNIEPIDTIAGKLLLIKIRKPDPTRPEIGDADFTVPNYNDFKKKYLPQKGFKLIPREGFEMIELMEEGMDVRVYFSNPSLDIQFGIVY